MTQKIFRLLVFSLVCSITFACAENTQHQVDKTKNPKKEKKDPALSDAPEICSTLNFDDVTWPTDYSELDEVAFALGMNITGSFEGHGGWTTISNNFDGQGVSLGILNQNLGSGTLQPLMIKLRDNHIDVMKKHLTDDMLDSFLEMLSDWERSRGLLGPSGFVPGLVHHQEAVQDFSKMNLTDTTEFRELVVTDDLDIEKKYATRGLDLMSQSAKDSVRWAVRTLYTDSKGIDFKPEWKKALKAIAGEPEYVSYQIEAAQYIHNRTMEYRGRVGWKELRSYLFLFDIVVQNGSLRDKHFNKYAKWLAKNPNATEEEQMLEMLEIRVVDSHPKWQEDVRRRKTAVILGEGFVHGENRNLPVEYCYAPTLIY